MHIVYENARQRVALKDHDTIVVDTSAVGTRLGNAIAKRARARDGVYITHRVQEELLCQATSRRLPVRIRENFQYRGKNLVQRLEDTGQIIRIARFDPMLLKSDTLLPKAHAEQGIAKHLWPLYNFCETYCLRRKKKTDALTLKELRGTETSNTRRLKRILNDASTIGYPDLHAYRKKIRDELETAYNNLIDEHVEDHTITAKLSYAHAGQLDAITLRVLGNAITGRGPQDAIRNKHDLDSNTTDRSSVQLALDLRYLSPLVTLLSADCDHQHYLWLYQGLTGETVSLPRGRETGR